MELRTQRAVGLGDICALKWWDTPTLVPFTSPVPRRVAWLLFPKRRLEDSSLEKLNSLKKVELKIMMFGGTQ